MLLILMTVGVNFQRVFIALSMTELPLSSFDGNLKCDNSETFILKKTTVYINSKYVNSVTDTIRSTLSSQHQREKQTNTIKQPQKDRWHADPAALFKKKKKKKWQVCYPNLTEYTTC